MFNKFYHPGTTSDNVKIVLQFKIKLHNITRQKEGKYDPLGFLMDLQEHFLRQACDKEIVKIFLNCRKADDTSLIPNCSFLEEQVYYSCNIKLQDNPNNPMTGTEENPLQYKAILTLQKFALPDPAMENCMKKGCAYKNYFAICRNHEDEATAQELKIIADYQAAHANQLREFKAKLNTIAGTYNLVGSHQLPPNEIDDSVMIVTSPTN